MIKHCPCGIRAFPLERDFPGYTQGVKVFICKSKSVWDALVIYSIVVLNECEHKNFMRWPPDCGKCPTCWRRMNWNLWNVQTLTFFIKCQTKSRNSSLHWTILILFYDLFLQWSINPKGPKTPSSKHFQALKVAFINSKTLFLLCFNGLLFT